MNFQTAVNNKVEATKEDTINIHDARELLGSKLFAKIMLDQETYLLKITKQNKLILTK
ncbi:MAG: hemin uptake protein HemP [Paracoccaceae bacterium]|nr:hemin uptake protein HemP [Paracoccaceae bacterium]